MLCDKEFPKKETLDSAELINPHGGGIAWTEKQKNGKKTVKYEKGITAKRMWEIITSGKAKVPAVIHFRISTIGGVKDELTHPFPITKQAETKLKGKANAVLFHNGHLNEWQELCLQTVIRKGVEFPEGDWSDTRGLAWLLGHHGIGFLNLIEADDGYNKYAILTPQGITKYGSGWKQVDKNLCSNDDLDPNSPYSALDDDEWRKYFDAPRNGSNITVINGKNYGEGDQTDNIDAEVPITGDALFDKMFDEGRIPIGMMSAKTSDDRDPRRLDGYFNSY